MNTPDISSIDTYTRYAKNTLNKYIDNTYNNIDSELNNNEDLYKQDLARIDNYLENNKFRWNPLEAVRLALGPDIYHQDIQDFCREMEKVKWFAEEVRFDHDKLQWEELDNGTKQVVKHILGFFSIADQIVMDNISFGLKESIHCIDAEHVYVAQEEQERIHQKSYLLQTQAILRGQELNSVLNAVRTMKTVKNTSVLMKKYTDSNKYSFGIRLIANTLSEGVLFSGCFTFLQWLRERNILPGITESNDFIMRDEGIHTRFGAHLVNNYLLNKPSHEEAYIVTKEFVDIAIEFIEEAIPIDMAGMKTSEMKEYIKFQTDTVLRLMGYPNLYNSKNPFKFMEKIAIEDKKNFFERNPTEYTNEINPEHYKVEFSFKKVNPLELDEDYS